LWCGGGGGVELIFFDYPAAVVGGTCPS